MRTLILIKEQSLISRKASSLCCLSFSCVSKRKPEASSLLWELKFCFFLYMLLALSEHNISGPNFDTSLFIKIVLEMGKAEKKVHLYDIHDSPRC